MLFISSMPVLIRHLWQLKTVVSLHWCLICAVLLVAVAVAVRCFRKCKQLIQYQHLLLFRDIWWSIF